MAEEDRSDSGADDYYDDGEEVYDDEGYIFSFFIFKCLFSS